MTSADIASFYETLKLIRKGNSEDFEVRASADEKLWAVKAFTESPKSATIVLYAGPDAKELAAEFSDLELDDDDGEEEDDEDDSDDEDDDEDE